MADNEDRDDEDLGEEASTYKIEESRRKGQVFQSRDVSGLAAFIAAASVAYALSPAMGERMFAFMQELFQAQNMAKIDLGQSGVLGNWMYKCLGLVAFIVLPVALSGFIVGGVTSFAQVGSIFATEPLMPDPTRISPLSGFKKLVSKKHMIDSVVLMIKATVLLFMIYRTCRKIIESSPRFMDTEPGGQLQAIGEISWSIIAPVTIALAIFAVLDYLSNRWEYMKQHKLTKKEAKEEFKEKEGDPAIKARIRAIQRNLARKRMMDSIKKADVIITNPTHIAIAIAYDKDKMLAPRVVAKGADLIAQNIKKMAAEHGVPMVENVPLARTLYKTVKIGQTVPKALYQAVAEVLAYVYRLKGKV
jgi:flagellar biosynthetic protein FlhB